MNRDDIIRMARDAGFVDIHHERVWIREGYHEVRLERFATLVAAEKQEEIERLKRENAILRQELKYRISSDILFTEVPHLLDMTKEEADAQAEKEITHMVLHNEGAE